MATAASVAPAMMSATMVARVVPSSPWMRERGFFRAEAAVASSFTARGSLPLIADRRGGHIEPHRLSNRARAGALGGQESDRTVRWSSRQTSRMRWRAVRLVSTASTQSA